MIIVLHYITLYNVIGIKIAYVHYSRIGMLVASSLEMKSLTRAFHARSMPNVLNHHNNLIGILNAISSSMPSYYTFFT